MIGLLVFKERIRAFYAKYAAYATPVMKFVYAFLIFFTLNDNIGYMKNLKSPVIVTGLALVCCVLPYGAISVIAALFMLAQVSAVSLELALITTVFMLIVGLLYYGFQPGDSYLLVLVPFLFAIKIPYAIPLLIGLSGGIMSIIPISCGVVIFYILIYVKQNVGVLTNDTAVEITQKYSQIVKTLLSNKLMLVMIVAIAVALITVHVIKTLSIDYSWAIAIAGGTIAQLVVIFIGDFTMNVSIPIAQLLFGIAGAVAVAGIYHFFVFTVDYSRTEYVQFEDDDYYYYVKAVPKITVSTPDVRVQKINSRKTHKNAR